MVKIAQELQSGSSKWHVLIPHCPKICEILGIAMLQDFKYVTVADVESVSLPKMQQHFLNALARENGVGTDVPV